MQASRETQVALTVVTSELRFVPNEPIEAVILFDLSDSVSAPSSVDTSEPPLDFQLTKTL